MFPSCNFVTTRSHPTRRTGADAFGQIAPVISREAFADLPLEEEIPGEEDEEIISQRTWCSETEDFSKIPCRRIFAAEVRIVMINKVRYTTISP